MGSKDQKPIEKLYWQSSESDTPTVRTRSGEKLVVYFSRKAYHTIRAAVSVCTAEIGWLGTVIRQSNGSFLIEEIFIFEQEVTGMRTKLSAKALMDFIVENRKKGPAGRELLDKIKFWGHSHVNMPTDPSPKDEETMGLFEKGKHPWFLRGIFNKNGSVRLDIFYFEENLVISNVPWALAEEIDPSILAEVSKTISEKVIIKADRLGSPDGYAEQFLSNLGFPDDGPFTLPKESPQPLVRTSPRRKKGE